MQWFETTGDSPCPDTGLWMVHPDIDQHRRRRVISVIHIDSILRAAHLMGVCGSSFIPDNPTYSTSLQAFRTFYVNKYADHHSILVILYSSQYHKFVFNFRKTIHCK